MAECRLAENLQLKPFELVFEGFCEFTGLFQHLIEKIAATEFREAFKLCIDVFDCCDCGRDLHLDRREFAAQGSGLVGGEADWVDQNGLDIF